MKLLSAFSAQNSRKMLYECRSSVIPTDNYFKRCVSCRFISFVFVCSFYGTSTVMRFSVQGSNGTIPGPKLAKLLRNQLLREKTDFLLFKVLRVDTVSEYTHSFCSIRSSLLCSVIDWMK